VSTAQDSHWKSLPLGKGVELIAADANGLAAFNKPAGILSHPNKAGEEVRSLLNAPYAIDGEFYQVAGGRRIWLLNRLDSATSGVILLTASENLAKIIRELFKGKTVYKSYYAVVFGKPQKATELWRDRLAIEKKAGQIRTSTGHIPSESNMKLSKSWSTSSGTVSLIQLEPRTGRSHQLRVQCATRHLPIIGDQTYGDFNKNKLFTKSTGSKRLFLHSYETMFTYQYAGKPHVFSVKAEIPAEFSQG